MGRRGGAPFFTFAFRPFRRFMKNEKFLAALKEISR